MRRMVLKIMKEKIVKCCLTCKHFNKTDKVEPCMTCAQGNRKNRPLWEYCGYDRLKVIL